MKAILLLSLIFSMFAAHAEDSFVSNHECIGVYREGYVDLKDYVESYNDENIDEIDFSVLVAGNSTEIAFHRTACVAFENPVVEECVLKYKDLYKQLRAQISLRSVLTGNQQRISYTEQVQEVLEVNEVQKEPRNWYQGLRNVIRTGSAVTREEVEKTKQIAKLAIFDEQCGY